MYGVNKGFVHTKFENIVLCLFLFIIINTQFNSRSKHVLSFFFELTVCLNLKSHLKTCYVYLTIL